MVEQVRQGRLGVDRILAGRYEVICRLARGGMGTVYLGRQIGLDRRVAIKVLHPEKRADEELVSLFKREAAAIKHLTHPNTIRLYDVGETESGLLYLVMEYLEGECLDAVLERQGALPHRLVVHLGMQVLKSLIEAHARGIVHRDIKPSNLMLCRQLGESDFVKVLDFGIAWHRLRGAPESPDKPGEVMGTPRYMSPEQLMGLEVDPRSDLYSLGLTLLELATGRPVFASNQLDQCLAERARRRRVELPAELQGTRLGAVVARALEESAAKRFPAAGDMLEALLATPLPVSLVDVPVMVHYREPLPGDGPADTPVGGAGALDPTLPRFPGQPLPTTDLSELESFEALEADTRPGEEPTTATAADEIVTLEHPLTDLLRARVEERLRRRTALTALLTAGAMALLALGLALVIG